MLHSFSRTLVACGVVLFASLISFLCTPGASVAATSSIMGFTLLTEGPAAACATACRQLISASGVITSDTARQFLAFVRDNVPQPPHAPPSPRPLQGGE